VMSLTFVGLAVGVLGPGEWSLDEALDLRDLAGWSGLLITLLAGGGGAGLLLAATWRPPRPEPARSA
jgi:putative oxidoreductase